MTACHPSSNERIDALVGAEMELPEPAKDSRSGRVTLPRIMRKTNYRRDAALAPSRQAACATAACSKLESAKSLRIGTKDGDISEAFASGITATLLLHDWMLRRYRVWSRRIEARSFLSLDDPECRSSTNALWPRSWLD